MNTLENLKERIIWRTISVDGMGQNYSGSHKFYVEEQNRITGEYRSRTVWQDR